MSEVITFLEEHLFSCSFKTAFGVDCPGCGMQRAFLALIKGNLVESLNFNASLIPFLLTFFYSIAHLIINFKNGARNIVWFFCITVGIMVVNFVIKMASAH